MKTYQVITNKEETKALIEAGLPTKNGKTSWSTGNLHPAKIEVEIYKDEICQATIHFSRLRDAYEFAIWASGWIAAFWSNGKVPTGISIIR